MSTFVGWFSHSQISTMTKILLVEAHAIVRIATKLILNEILGPVNIYESQSFGASLKQLASDQFDLVMLDLTIPEGESYHMIQKLRTIQPGVRILIFSAKDESLYAPHYLKAGANGYLTKLAPDAEIKKAILAVLNDERYVSTTVRQQLGHNTSTTGLNHDSPLQYLSPREMEVMDLLLKGKWTKEIAGELKITISSVSTYKTRIFEKLEVSNLIEMFNKVQLYSGSQS